jgi:hypothetical protein
MKLASGTVFRSSAGSSILLALSIQGRQSRHGIKARLIGRGTTTTTEAMRLIRVLRKVSRAQSNRAKHDRMTLLVESRIYTSQGKLTKHFR